MTYGYIQGHLEQRNRTMLFRRSIDERAFLSSYN